jgi:hypothetical protein
MNADLTISTLAYKMRYSDQTGSERREVSRGATLPTNLLIKNQAYVDSATKLAGTRTLVRFDHHMAISSGIIVPAASLYLVSARLNDPLVTASIIESLEAQMVNLLHGTSNTNGLDLVTEILVNGEQ